MPEASPAGQLSCRYVSRAVVTGEFNGDGRSDLAVANSATNSVSLLLGNANGTFQAARNIAGRPARVPRGRRRQQRQQLDLATANVSDISIVLSNGNGTFQAPTNIGLNLQSVAVGDFNGDGKLDLGVTSGHFYYGGYYGGGFSVGGASVLLGNGGGSFSAAKTGTRIRKSRARSLKDFNGDGRADSAVVNSDSGSVEVQLANPDGSLAAVRSYAVGYSRPESVAVRDFNGDGKLGLVTAGAGSVSVLHGNPDGTFQPASGLHHRRRGSPDRGGGRFQP